MWRFEGISRGVQKTFLCVCVCGGRGVGSRALLDTEGRVFKGEWELGGTPKKEDRTGEF